MVLAASAATPSLAIPMIIPDGRGGSQGDVSRVFNYVRLVRDADTTNQYSREGASLPLVVSESDTSSNALTSALSLSESPSQPGNSQHHPIELATAAERLGVSEQDLREALGPLPPDFEAAAQILGITVEELRSALGIPGTGAPPEGGPPSQGG